MPLQAADNTNLKNLSGKLPAGFNPVVTYTNDGTNVVVTDGTAIPAGDTLKKVKIQVFDKFGGEVRDVITVTGGPGAKTLSLATLNKSKPLDLKVTVLTTNNIAADGGAYNLGASGSVSDWDSQQNA
jgi:hypothetical protein